MKKNVSKLFILLLLSVCLMVTYTCKKLEKSMRVSTGEVTNIQTNSAEASGLLIDPGEGVTQHGHCYGKNTNVSISNSKTLLGKPAGAGGFTSLLTNLEAGTKYYIKAYASDGSTPVYGEEISFTTLPISVPALTTTVITYVTTTAASSGGNITSEGGAPVTSRGVCWNTSTSPTTADSKTSDGTGTGSFTSNLSGLTPNTTYYVRAFASNSAGTGYGSELNFKTVAASPPSVTTSAITGITQTTATSGGNVTGDGGVTVTARGVCWNTSGTPTTSDNKTSDGTGIGSFTSSLTALTANTKYYIRAYATNSAGTAYGDELSFTTGTGPAVAPTLSTTAVTSVTSTTATSGGSVTSDGGAAVTTRGVCWSKYDGPSTSDTKTSDGFGTGSFTSNITGLTPGTLYHVRAYAINSAGVAYGNEVTFTTSAVLPNVTTTAISNITTTTSSSGGEVTSDGGASVTSRGVCWSTTTGPTIADSKTSDAAGTGVFVSNITGLSVNTKYYVRAYATNSIGTAYGNEVNFTTSAAGTVVPTLTTTAISAVTTASAASGGNISSDGGAAVTARGVCWSTLANPTISLTTKTNDGTGSGSFISSLTSLTPNTTYYVRAYASNSVGTAYGNEVSFSTNPAVIATLTTTSITNITGTTATSGGNITNDGGGSISVRGVCWDITTNPTTGDSRTQNGPGTGTYVSNLTGLTPSTTYYIRAYATNSAGTAYGNELSFTTNSGTPVIPTLTTTSVTQIAAYTATSGGNISNDGGASITARGVCWNISPYPSIANNKTSEGPGSGTFVSSITGLTANTTYYVRAYATNSVGTAYGDEISFTTSIGVPTLSTSPINTIGSTSAKGGGEIISDCGATVTTYGICWSTSHNPTVTDGHTSDAGGSGSFISSLIGLIPGTTYYVRAYATNSIGPGYGDEQSFTTLAACTLFQVTHTAGDVAPVTKTVNYGAVETNLSGSIKCWITQNLGASNQAGSASDATEAAAGWYWQFHTKQGYKHDGTNRTPVTTWTDNSLSSDWTSDKDPCTILLGTGWRIPTITEWTNVHDNGAMGNRNDAYASVLKLHPAGYVDDNLYNRGSNGIYWSITYQYVCMWCGSNAGTLNFDAGTCQIYTDYTKIGHSVRCIRD